MRKLLLLVVLSFIYSSTANSVTLDAGDIARLQFDGLEIWGDYGAGDFGNFKVNSSYFTANNLTLKVELYSNDFSQPPVQSYIISDEPPYLPWGSVNIDQTVWQDLQGAVALTVLSGSFDFELFEIDIGINGVNYVQDFYASEFAIVPIPPAIILFISGFIVVATYGCRKNLNSMVLLRMSCK